MIVRVSDPVYRLDLVVFLRDHGFAAIEEVDVDRLRVFEADKERLLDALMDWRLLQGVGAEVVA